MHSVFKYLIPLGSGRVFNFGIVFLGCVLAPIGLVAILFLTLVPEPELPVDPVARAVRLLEVGDPAGATALLKDKLQDHVFDVPYNRAYLSAHFSVPAYLGRGQARKDEGPRSYYENLCDSTDETTRAHGCYYSGLYYSYKDERELALERFDRVGGLALPYLNFSKGRIFQDFGQFDRAIAHFRAELGTSADRGVVVGALSSALAEAGEWDALEGLIEADDDRPHVAPSAMRAYHLARGEVIGYLYEVWALYGQLQIVSLLCAALGLAIWLHLLHWWLAPYSLGWLRTTVVVVASASLAHFVLIAQDACSLIFNVGFRGEIVGDFLFSVTCVGLLEEAAKFLPVGLYAVLRKKGMRPLDWMVIGASSGIGFGAMEAYTYTVAYGAWVAPGRLFVSLPLHLFLSAAIGIAIGESSERSSRPFVVFILALCAAALAHGLFDYLLLGPIKEFSILAIVPFLLLTLAFIRGRDGLLYLNGYKWAPNESVDARMQTRWGFVGFAILNGVILAMVGLQAGRDSLLLRSGLQILSSGAPLFALFLLSRRPLAAGWHPRWYHMKWMLEEPRSTE